MEKGIKHDGGKVRPSLIPLESMMEVIKVLEFGAIKYGVDNWQKVDDAPRRYYDALLRHVYAHHMGEVVDAESGLSHLAHASTNLLMLLHFEIKKQENKDEN